MPRLPASPYGISSSSSDLLLVSNFAAGEISSAVAKATRDKRSSADDAYIRLVDFDTWRATATTEVIVLRSDLDAAGALVRQFDLEQSFPAAIHAVCCKKLGATLVTFDDRLGDAAIAIGLEVTRPG